MLNTPTAPNKHLVYVLVNGDLHRVKGCSDTQDVVDTLAQYLREKEAASSTEYYYRCVIYTTILISPAFRNTLFRKAEGLLCLTSGACPSVLCAAG